MEGAVGADLVLSCHYWVGGVYYCIVLVSFILDFLRAPEASFFVLIFYFRRKMMSSAFKKPKVKVVQPEEVVPEIVDDSEIVRNMEKRRQKKMGAYSQFLSHDNSYGKKTTLGG